MSASCPVSVPPRWKIFPKRSWGYRGQVLVDLCSSSIQQTPWRIAKDVVHEFKRRPSAIMISTEHSSLLKPRAYKNQIFSTKTDSCGKTYMQSPMQSNLHVPNRFLKCRFLYTRGFAVRTFIALWHLAMNAVWKMASVLFQTGTLKHIPFRN